MPRPQSLFERFTKSVIPPPDLTDRFHLVLASEFIINVANKEYGLELYSPDRWRDMAEANNIENPFLFNQLPENGGFQGKLLRVPSPPPPDFA